MHDTDLDTLAARLSEIVAEAAELILPLWKAGLQVHTKSDDSPVTEADRRAETLILERLATSYPGVTVISEEDASEFGLPGKIGARFFLVDPLDGTKAFVRGDPNFTVNIGLIEDGVPVAGAIAAPATGEAWRGASGSARKRGADGGWRPVRARTWDAADSLALVSHTTNPEALTALRERHGFTRSEPMDSSIKLCRIAEGAADLYVRGGPTMEWDIAAGHAILLAAGGRLTAPDGSPFVYGKATEGFRNGPFIARGPV